MNQDGLECKLKELGKIISDKMGIDFADRRLPDLRRGIERAAKELGYIDWVSCLHWLLSTPMTKDTLKVLAGHLTIGETYFFRDEKLFKAIGQRILLASVSFLRSFTRLKIPIVSYGFGVQAVQQVKNLIRWLFSFAVLSETCQNGISPSWLLI